ncbi:MAG: metallophosphoesterase [Nitrosopumilus sp.]|nr:metallophosphoesterase [Nitrosopumilus sp.]
MPKKVGKKREDQNISQTDDSYSLTESSSINDSSNDADSSSEESYNSDSTSTESNDKSSGKKNKNENKRQKNGSCKKGKNIKYDNSGKKKNPKKGKNKKYTKKNVYQHFVLKEYKKGEELVRYLIHTSDWHIRNDRYDEYEKVFDNVDKKIENDEHIKNMIMVVPGDLIHKYKMDPEAFGLLFGTLKKFAKRFPVFVTPGNHDCNILDKKKKDIYDSMIHHMKIENLHYLGKTGSYQYKNVIFGVTNVRDGTKIFKASSIDNEILTEMNKNYGEDFAKIALYHGMLNHTVINPTHTVKKFSATIKDFDGYDIACLGDIHKKQILGNGNIGYCGSLIQQDHGEILGKHGIYKWNIRKRKAEFIEIKNNYGYVSINIEDGMEKIKNITFPKKANIRICRGRESEIEYAKFVDFVKEYLEKHDVEIICITSKPYTFRETNNEKYGKSNKGKIKNLSSKKEFAKCIEEFIQEGINVDNIEFEKMIEIHKKVYSNLTDEKKNARINGNHSWTIENFAFDNGFCFGKGNHTNFDKNDMKHKILMMIAKNHTGKSGYVELLLWTLFGKCIRGKDIINKLCTNMKSILCIVIDSTGDRYKITRTATRKENLVTTITLEKYDKHTKKYINQKGKKTVTDDNIIKLVGTYDDFLMTSICTQDQDDAKNKNILGKAENEQAESFSHILGLDFFPKCVKIAGTKETKYHNKIIDYEGNLRGLSQGIKCSMPIDTEDNRNKELEKLKKEKLIFEKSLSNLGKKIIETSKPHIDSTLSEEYKIKDTVTMKNIERAIKDIKMQIKSCEDSDQNEVSEKIKRLKSKLSNLDYEKVKCKIGDKIDDYLEEINELNMDYDNKIADEITEEMAEELEELEEKLDTLKKETERLKSKLNKKFNDNNVKLDDDYVNRRIKKLNGKKLKNEYAIKEIKKKSNQKLLNKKKTLEKKLSKIEKPLTEKEKVISEYIIKRNSKEKKEYNDILEKLDQLDSSYDDDLIEIIDKIKKRIKLLNKKTKKHELMLEIDDDDYSQIQNKLKEIIIEIDNNDEHNKKVFENNKLLEKNNEIINELECFENFKKKKVSHDKVADKVNTATNLHNNIKKNLKILQKKNKITKQMNDEKSKLKQLNSSYENYKSRIIQYKKAKENIAKLEKNLKAFEKYKKDLNKYEEEMKINEKYEPKIKEIEVKHLMIINEIETKEKIFKKITKVQKKIKTNKSMKENYTNYIKIMHPSALQNFILRKHVPQIISTANSFLGAYSDFQLGIKFEKDILSRKKKSTAKNPKLEGTEHNGLALEFSRIATTSDGEEKIITNNIKNGSGYEKFIANIALRYAFRSSINIVKSNLLVIDEGWSCNDKDNLEKVGNILNFLKEEYTHLLIISHLEPLKDLGEYNLHITQKNGISYINNKQKEEEE